MPRPIRRPCLRARSGTGRGILACTLPRKSEEERRTVALPERFTANTLGVPMPDGSAFPASALFRREHPNAAGAPHRVGGAENDPSNRRNLPGRLYLRRERLVLAIRTVHPLAENTVARADPQPERGLPALFTVPKGCLPASLDRRRNLVGDPGIGHRYRSGMRSAPETCPDGIAWQNDRARFRATQTRESLLVAAVPTEVAMLLRRTLASCPERLAVLVLTFKGFICIAYFPTHFMKLSGSVLARSFSDYSCDALCLETARIPYCLIPRAYSLDCCDNNSSECCQFPYYRSRSDTPRIPVVMPVAGPCNFRMNPRARHQSSIVLAPPTRRIITRNTKINKVWITDSAATSVNELPTHKSNT